MAEEYEINSAGSRKDLKTQMTGYGAENSTAGGKPPSKDKIQQIKDLYMRKAKVCKD